MGLAAAALTGLLGKMLVLPKSRRGGGGLRISLADGWIDGPCNDGCWMGTNLEAPLAAVVFWNITKPFGDLKLSLSSYDSSKGGCLDAIVIAPMTMHQVVDIVGGEVVWCRVRI